MSRIKQPGKEEQEDRRRGRRGGREEEEEVRRVQKVERQLVIYITLPLRVY